MKIGIISDIHGYPDKFKNAVKVLSGCQIILCAGDVLYHGPRNPILDGYRPTELVEEIKALEIPMLIARGNCDADVDLMLLEHPFIPPYVLYENNNVRFILTHGHDVDLQDLHKMAKSYKANVVITGHTHIRKYENINGIIYINPGSISLPKGDAITSCAVYDEGEFKFINTEDGSIIL